MRTKGNKDLNKKTKIKINKEKISKLMSNKKDK